MYTNILERDTISFKVLEQIIFEKHCRLAQEETVSILATLDEMLLKKRDVSKYRCLGFRQTTIKTIFGEVTFKRRVYRYLAEDGKKKTIYLLDEYIGMEKIGMFSTNLAEKIVESAISSPYRTAANTITNTTGQNISHGAVWNITQSLGEKLQNDEDRIVSEYRRGESKGKKETPILFEEMDGVYIKMQGENASKAPSQEVKISTIYEGWSSDEEKRSKLVGRTVVAGLEKTEEFLEKREAKICDKYDVDLIGQRILNGDGGSWIEDRYDPDTIRQLDRFHVIRAIKTYVSHEGYAGKLLKKLKDNDIDGLIDYAQIYYDSVCTKAGNSRIEEDAEKLLKYLNNNRYEISRYYERQLSFPEPPEGIIYKNMGVQENQNCTVITLRMKGGRKRWKPASANNMVKLLYYNQNRELIDAIDRYIDNEFLLEPIVEEVKNVLSAAKAPKTDGKGNNRYVEGFNVHMPILDSVNTRTAGMFRKLLNT